MAHPLNQGQCSQGFLDKVSIAKAFWKNKSSEMKKGWEVAIQVFGEQFWLERQEEETAGDISGSFRWLTMGVVLHE